ncbi:MAG: PEGA domain-containing protein [bacterium]
MYTIGYRYDWSMHKPYETGSLSVDIQPKNGQVFLNQVELKKNTLDKKIKLKNVEQGKYLLSIKTEGYYDWQKEIEIKSKQTVYIKEINLIKKNLPELLIDKEIISFSLSSDNQFLIYQAKNNQQTEIWLLDQEQQKENLLFKSTSTYSMLAEWAPKYNCATINLSEKKIKPTLLCIDKTPELASLPISTGTLQKTQWKQGTQPELFYSTEQGIFSFIPATGNTKKISGNQFVDWYMEDNRLWVMEYNTTSKKIEVIKDRLGFSSKFTEITLKEKELDENQTNYQLLICKDDNVLIKKNESEMTIINNQRTHNLNGENLLISPHNDWWLIWSPWELWTYIENELPELQNRSGAGLGQVAPLDEYNALALAWNDKVTVLYPYYLVTHNLLDTGARQVATDSKNRKLYHTPYNKKGLWVLNY